MFLNDFFTIQNLGQEGQSIRAELQLNKDHAIFQGHFPDNPVLPGVVMMTMVKAVLEQALMQHLQLQEAKSVKFLGVVNPNEHPTLVTQCDWAQQLDGTIKTNSTLATAEKVIYKSSAVYVQGQVG
jgi:3-hydroxyacyl-[acyl-carrier-protein] dehydratase